jgi:hypothetical protein
MKLSLVILVLFVACTTAPKPVCLPAPTTVAFENRSHFGVALTYGNRVYSLPPGGRKELLYSSTVYRVEAEEAPLPSGPYDEFGTLHVEVR